MSVCGFGTQETEYESLVFDLFTFLKKITHFSVQSYKVIGHSKLHNKFYKFNVTI